MTPKDIKKIRGDISREEFSLLLGVSSVTLWRWEQGGARPEGASLRLLEILSKDRKQTITLLSKYAQERLKTI
jgi:DNA-binding transcriptional regulator YiaG